MAKQTNKTGVDIFIADELSNDDAKQVVKSLLIIPLAGIKSDAALRVTDKDNSQVLYCSTRLPKSLVRNDAGFETDVTGNSDKLIGCSYTLIEQGGSKTLLQEGKIAAKNTVAASKIVPIADKTGTNN